MSYFPGTKRYSPLSELTSSSCGGFWPLAEAFFVLRAKKKSFFTLIVLILGNFWCSVVTSVTFLVTLVTLKSSKKFQKSKKIKKFQKFQKIQKIAKIKKKFENKKKIIKKIIKKT